MPTLVVSPTYQEAANIAQFLQRVRAANPDVAILVVDDGSPDGTADLAEAMQTEVGDVTVMRRTAKNGLGAAYRAGFAWGLERDYDVIVEMDADLSHDPAQLPSLLQAIDEGADLAIGSRYVPGGTVPPWSLYRKVLSRWGNRYAGMMLGLPVRDATSGFRAYSVTRLAKLDLDALRADGYGFQIEMAWRIAQDGGDIREVPIDFADRTAGTSKMSSRIVVEALALVTLWGVRRGLHH